MSNEILDFAQGAGATVLTQAEYAALTAVLGNGFQSGVLPATYLNKVLRQHSLVCVAIAKLIDAAGISVLDDGDSTGFKNDFLTALSTSFTTPNQFDNDTSVATTAFVQRALGNNQGVRIVTGNITLTAADVGKLIVGGSASPFTVTLPLTSTLVDGAKFECVNMNAGNMTIQRQGTTDVINTSSTRTSEVLGTGDSLVLHAKPSLGMFYASGGTNQFAYAAKFGSLQGANGYKKIPDANSPNGFMLLQWGQVGNVGVGGVTANFPTSFPNNAWVVVPQLSVVSGPVTQYVNAVQTATPKSSVIFAVNTGTAAVGYIAIGN